MNNNYSDNIPKFDSGPDKKINFIKNHNRMKTEYNNFTPNYVFLNYIFNFFIELSDVLEYGIRFRLLLIKLFINLCFIFFCFLYIYKNI